MRHSAGHGAFALLLILLALEIFGVGVYFAGGLRSSSTDFCRGYAICV